jgi:hypothetical protein
MARCSNPANPSNGVVHIQGGPFLGWGGGVGTAMKDYPGRPSMPVKAGTPATIASAAVDASAWEGISFWARRGPDSQVGFRVLAGDKNTDDDISYLMYHADPTTPRFCERVRECACLNHQACQDVAFSTVQAEHPECTPAILRGTGADVGGPGRRRDEQHPVQHLPQEPLRRLLSSLPGRHRHPERRA